MRRAVIDGGPVKVRRQHHALHPVNPLRRDALREGLFDGMAGAADQVVREAGLHPEVRREVGQIGHHRDKGRSGRQGLEACSQGPVEVGHQRHHQIGAGLRPMLRQTVHHLLVAQADHGLQHPQFRRQANREAGCQAPVVVGLGGESRQTQKPLIRIQHLEEIDETNRPMRVGDRQLRLQRPSGCDVAPSGTEVDQVQGCRKVSSDGQVQNRRVHGC